MAVGKICRRVEIFLPSNASAIGCCRGSTTRYRVWQTGTFIARKKITAEFKQFMKNDIVTLLRDNHELLHVLSSQLRSCARHEQVRPLFKQFSLALGGQLGAMNRVIYPALKSQGWREVRSDMLVGHAKLAQALAELLTIKPDSGAFADALSDLLDATEHVLGLEARHLLPLVARNFDGAQCVALGFDAEPYLRAAAEIDPLDSRLLSDWMDEARLILGGLQTKSASTGAPDEEHLSLQ